MECNKILLIFLLVGTAKLQSIGDCDFADDLCGYVATNDNGGKFVWSLIKSTPPSHQTGPFGDHKGKKTKSYLYTESSFPAEPNNEAVLTSPEIAAQGPSCLSFWYNAHGKGMGKLVVETDQNGAKETIFESIGEKGVNWINVQEHLPTGNSFKIVFTSVRGSNFTSDMAIDNIELLPGVCAEETAKEELLIGDVIVPDLCPRETGFCVKANGGDQNSGVETINREDGDTESAQKKCLEECQKDPKATACEVIWHQGNRGCYRHTQEVARGNGAERHMCWVLSKCTDTVVKKICPRERGFCVKQDGRDQNSGVRRINRRDGDHESAKLECIKQCGAHGGATGCEVIWDQGNRGCYIHTQEIARGNEADRHTCWVFSKCQEYDESAYVTVQPPIQQAPIVPAPIYGVKRIGCYKNEEYPFPQHSDMQRDIDPVTFADKIRKCRDIVDSKGNDYEIFGVSDFGRRCYYGNSNDFKLNPFKGGKADSCGDETIGGHDSLYIYKSCKDEKTCASLNPAAFVPVPIGANGQPVIFCEHKGIKRISCSDDEVIEVKSALYGRTASNVCGRNSNTNCRAANSFEIVKKQCDGLSYCDLIPSNAVFGDPCRGTVKYLELKYDCVPRTSEARRAVLCQHQKHLPLSCPSPDEVLNINAANYGRLSTDFCQFGHFKQTDCRALGSEDKIKQTCNGKNSCSINPTDSAYGNPCGGVWKYISVDYTCQ